MSNLTKRIKETYNKIVFGSQQNFAYFHIKTDQVEDQGKLGKELKEGEHYFRVLVNELFLANARVLWSEYDPVVFSAVEFLYDKKMQEEPKLIGPDILGSYQKPISQGVRFIDTPVSGIHPFRGGDFTITLILYKVKRSNHLQDLIKVVEKVVTAVSPSIAFNSYLLLSSVIMDGMDLILSTRQTEPIFATRETLNVSTSSGFKPGYCAIINTPEAKLQEQKFWVRGGRLCVGNTMESSKPYTDSDFVLFSVVQSDERDDIEQLPFYPLWQEALHLAARANGWNEAKISYSNLYHNLLSSPDLAEPQKANIIKSYEDELQRQREEAKRRSKMGQSYRGTDEKTPSSLTDAAQHLDGLFNNLD